MESQQQYQRTRNKVGEIDSRLGDTLLFNGILHPVDFSTVAWYEVVFQHYLSDDRIYLDFPPGLQLNEEKFKPGF